MPDESAPPHPHDGHADDPLAEWAPEAARVTAMRAIPPRDGRAQGRAVYVAARARNVVRHPWRVFAVGSTVFLLVLIALVFLPRASRRLAERQIPPPSARPDTAALAERARVAGERAAAVEGRIAAARRRLAALAAQAAADSIPPEQRVERDSLVTAAAVLSRLIARAENAPLAASYRALAEAAPLRGSARVRALADSLSEVEREREAFETGGADPIYVALTARANAIGRAILGVAVEERARIRERLVALRPRPAPVAPAPIATATATPAAPVADAVAQAPVATTGTAPAAGADGAAAAGASRPAAAPDTMELLRARDAARVAVVQADRALAGARRRLVELDSIAAAARARANVDAPPSAILLAALVLGLAFGFLMTFLAELRAPRLADAAEAERVTQARVLAVIPGPEDEQERLVRPRTSLERLGEWARDLPLTTPAEDALHVLAMHLTATGAAVPQLFVVGDDDTVSAAIAAGLAATTAREARGTLLVDAAAANGIIPSELLVRPRPGWSNVVRGAARWTEALVTPALDRERLLDVIPSGADSDAKAIPHPSAEALDGLRRLTRRYDLAIVHTTPATALAIAATSAAPLATDVLVTARIGATSLRALGDLADRLDAAGLRVVGLALWNGEAPRRLGREELLLVAERAAALEAEELPHHDSALV